MSRNICHALLLAVGVDGRRGHPTFRPTLFSFIGVVSTGALLRGFPDGLAGHKILSLTRYDWADLHWVLSLLFLGLIAVHFLLHWNWMKVNFERRLKLGPKVLAAVLAVATIGLCVVAPAYLTRDLPSRKTVRETPSATSHSQAERGTP